MKLLITGGHATAALAVIDAIQKSPLRVTCDLCFVGRRYMNAESKSDSLEYQEVKKRNIRFIHLHTGRLNRFISVRTISELLRIPLGFMHAWRIIHNERPDAVLSFGGYLAVPIVFSAWIRHIPIFSHEQTMIPGLANRCIGYICTTMFVAFPQAAHYFPKLRTKVVGNPIRSSVFLIRKTFALPQDGKPVLYVTGGSLGSHTINMHIKSLLPQLLERYCVIHQTGDNAQYSDYSELHALRDAFPAEVQQRYIILKHVPDEQIGFVYAQSQLVIGRAGANTCFELIALQKPAILIPLPWSARHEQQAQAAFLEKAGAVLVFDQSRSSSELAVMIDEIMNHIVQYQNQYASVLPIVHQHAASIIVETIEKTLS